MDIAIRTEWNKRITLKYLLFLLACCLLAYWPLTFGLFSLKNDAIIYFLPIRYLISDAIQHHHWPFWTPYLNLGYPLHGDMQSGVWNPFVQIFSLFGTYSLRTLQIETLLYVYLSGVGMFFLLKHFKLHPHTVLLVACAYMLFGFNSDSAQFLYWISGAAFLPFVFLFFYRTLFERSWRQSILLGFFLFLYFTTGYPGQFVLLAYLLIGFAIWFSFSNKIFKNKKIIYHYSLLLLLSGGSFVLLSLPAILSYLTYLPLMHRGGGVSYELAMSNPLHPAFLFSYISPLAIWRTPIGTSTDPLERNCFIGLITFTLFITSFFIKSDDKFSRFCKWSVFVFFILSLGEIGLLRPLTYYALPLMNSFRHPAIAKLFFNFFGCILASWTLQKAINDEITIKLRKNIWILLLTLTLIILAWGMIYFKDSQIINFISNKTIKWEEAKGMFDKLSFFDLLIAGIILQIPFLVVLYNSFVRKVKLKSLMIASIANCTFMAMLFQPFTVVRKESRIAVQNVINTYQRNGFPIPDIKSTIAANSVNNLDSVLRYGPLSLYAKEIGHSFNFLTPGRLKTQEQFWDNEKFRETIFQYPLLFRADTALYISDITQTENLPYKKIAVVEDSSLLHFINSNQGKIPFKARLTSFAPNSWTFEIISNEPGFYSFLQNNFPLWHMMIDGNNEVIKTCNQTFMGFKLDKGKHIVTFQYKANKIKIAFLLSIILSISIISWAVFPYKKSTTASF